MTFVICIFGYEKTLFTYVTFHWAEFICKTQVTDQYYSGTLKINNISARIFPKNVQFFHPDSASGTPRFFPDFDNASPKMIKIS